MLQFKLLLDFICVLYQFMKESFFKVVQKYNSYHRNHVLILFDHTHVFQEEGIYVHQKMGVFSYYTFGRGYTISRPLFRKATGQYYHTHRQESTPSWYTESSKGTKKYNHMCIYWPHKWINRSYQDRNFTPWMEFDSFRSIIWLL